MFELATQAMALTTYPLWVRLSVFGWVTATAIGYGLLLLLAPPAPPAVLRINDIRVVGLHGAPDFLGFEIFAGNDLAVSAQVTGMELELYASAPPAGGLQSSEEISASYFVSDGDVAKSGEETSQTVTAERPYAGNDYTRVTIPLSQTIDAGKSDRFLVAVKRADILLATHRIAAIRLIYNKDLKTAVQTVAIKP